MHACRRRVRYSATPAVANLVAVLSNAGPAQNPARRLCLLWSGSAILAHRCRCVSKRAIVVPPAPRPSDRLQ